MRTLADVLFAHRKTILCYVWIDGTGQNVRAKSKTVTEEPVDVHQCPDWNYDGSSTGQAIGQVSDVILKPVAMFHDPLRGQPHKLILCDTYDTAGHALKSNTRHSCDRVMKKVSDDAPWFGMEQEYTLIDNKYNVPVGWPIESKKLPDPQGAYYCGVGAGKVAGRAIVEDHYKACLSAGINHSGENAKAMIGQWEFQVGPCEVPAASLPGMKHPLHVHLQRIYTLNYMSRTALRQAITSICCAFVLYSYIRQASGIAMGDELWMARYLLYRIAEEHNVKVDIDPKPIEGGKGNGAYLNTNVSVKQSREYNGINVIDQAITRLEANHERCMPYYNPNWGKHKRHSADKHEKFTKGVADRTASVRIPLQVVNEKQGYFEDRRPASNADPYRVTEALVRSMYKMWQTDESSSKRITVGPGTSDSQYL